MIFVILLIAKSYAEFYISAGVSLNQTNNLNISIQSQEKIFQDFTNTQTDTSLFLQQVPNDVIGSGGSAEMVDVYKTITSDNNYSLMDNNLEITANTKQSALSYNLSIGYKFLKNFRIDAEFRSASFKNELNAIIGNITNNQTINYEYSCDNYNIISRNSNCTYDSLSSTQHNEINFSGNLLNFPANNNYTMSLNNKINYYFANFFYDVPFSIYYFGFFGGFGAGIAQINLSATSNLPISLSGSAITPAYQYKVGTFYNINDNIKFLISLTHINTIGDVKFNNFTTQPISQNSVDFNLMYIL
ncbi:MAG: hypothetical protein FWE18_06955 [Alphaproteobacteria bacterium]|nr:hypothetical protein [Alphaproteobacteria bacterium]